MSWKNNKKNELKIARKTWDEVWRSAWVKETSHEMWNDMKVIWLRWNDMTWVQVRWNQMKMRKDQTFKRRGNRMTSQELAGGKHGKLASRFYAHSLFRSKGYTLFQFWSFRPRFAGNHLWLLVSIGIWCGPKSQCPKLNVWFLAKTIYITPFLGS